jgi:coenzyme F420 biosynthesis associated uncharacterized protein
LSGLIDWDLAASVAALAAGESGQLPGPSPGDDLSATVAEVTTAVQAYTRLVPAQAPPAPEWVDRRQWAAINLDSMRRSLAPIEERLGGGEPHGPGAGTMRAALGLVTGAQVGALVGLASRRVLGQYEFSLLGAPQEPRLLFVGANIAEAQRTLGGEPRTVLRWIALHEVTHAVHLGAAPWIREYLGTLASRLLTESEPRLDLGELAAAARRVATSDPGGWLEELWSSDPLTLLAPPDSRELIARTQATMASIEGYAEHVMDAAAPAIGEQVGELRVALERRRESRPPLARLLAWLLGMELKLRQYRDGKRFSDSVVESVGIEGLNRAWRDPESLPTIAELADPDAWIKRTAATAAA